MRTGARARQELHTCYNLRPRPRIETSSHREEPHEDALAHRRLSSGRVSNGGSVRPSRASRECRGRASGRLGQGDPGGHGASLDPRRYRGHLAGRSRTVCSGVRCPRYGDRQPMATDLFMRIGSTSKTFTVTAVLMLADQGKLGLDTSRACQAATRLRSGSSRQCAAGSTTTAMTTNPKLSEEPFRQCDGCRRCMLSRPCCAYPPAWARIARARRSTHDVPRAVRCVGSPALSR